jgi:hypothetical protein
LSSNAFTKLTIKGDFWTVGVETMECIANSVGRLNEIEFIGMSMDRQTTKLLKYCLSRKSYKKRRLLEDCGCDEQPIASSSKAAAATSTVLKKLNLYRIHFEDPSILFMGSSESSFHSLE